MFLQALPRTYFMMILKGFDTTIANLIERLPSQLRLPFIILGYCTTPLTWIVLFVVLITIQCPNDQYKTSLALLLCLPIAGLLKLIFRRRRPPTIYAGRMRIKSYSFPSTHAYTGALGAGYIAILSFQNTMQLLGCLLMALTIVIGISRVQIGAHYPTDVMSGWLLALVILAIITSVT